MSSSPNIKTVAVVGCGSIGASWASLFAHHGLKTTVYDPNPLAEKTLRTIEAEASKVFASLNTNNNNPNTITCPPTSITFTTSLPTALLNADFVQENGPENLSVKSNLLTQIDVLLPPHVPILTSTSGLTCSSLTLSVQHPSRLAVGHPFNPPHLIPLVEVVGSPQTSPETITTAMNFYTSLGKKPIHLQREIPGHIANRLQAALFREILHLVESDVATVSDIETAMEFGPGLRWGVMGPSTLFHLGGGSGDGEGNGGGAEHFSKHILRPMMGWCAEETPVLGEELREKWVSQTGEVVQGEEFEELCRRRDEGIVGILREKK
ncbi:3-hydroxyacyl-CoA dehydrogenase [Cadophora sp. MPI-SDFR-AT-0126]|nr:3-hydroxyacyl-CoA dehydrogenase [Leotiomycetes sp. MPI-SDFR-AT-0126]